MQRKTFAFECQQNVNNNDTAYLRKDCSLQCRNIFYSVKGKQGLQSPFWRRRFEHRGMDLKNLNNLISCYCWNNKRIKWERCVQWFLFYWDLTQVLYEVWLTAAQYLIKLCVWWREREREWVCRMLISSLLSHSTDPMSSN